MTRDRGALSPPGNDHTWTQTGDAHVAKVKGETKRFGRHVIALKANLKAGNIHSSSLAFRHHHSLLQWLLLTHGPNLLLTSS